jgi:hypothetical protein
VSTETKWLIEAGPVSAPLYLNFHQGLPAWTFSAHDSCGFVTKEAAESALGLVDNPTGVRIAEHVIEN